MRARMPDDRHLSSDDELPPAVERAARTLRAEVPVRREWRARVLADVGQSPSQRAARRRALVLSWPRALAAGAALFVAGGAIVAATLMRRETRTTASDARSSGDLAAHTVVNAPKHGVTRFVFVAPNAQHVALVGDFNLWNPATAPMQRIAGSDAWVVDMSLPVGRHVYAFVVDGDVTADPSAPRTAGDDFGRPNSVILVSPRS